MSTKKILVLYYTLSGNSKRLAEYVQEALVHNGCTAACPPINVTKAKVEEIPFPAEALSADYVFLFTPIHYGRPPAPLYWGMRRLAHAGLQGKVWGIGGSGGAKDESGKTLAPAHALVSATMAPKAVHHVDIVESPDDFPFIRRTLLGNQFISMVRSACDGVAAKCQAVCDGTAPALAPEIQAKVDKAIAAQKEPSEGDFAEYGRMVRIMSHVVHDTPDVLDRCVGCGSCVRVCPEGYLEIKDKKIHIVEGMHCANCFGCYNVCPVQAINVTHTKAGPYKFKEEFLTETRVKTDAPFRK